MNPPIPESNQIICPYCLNSSSDLMEPVTILRWFCSVCARIFEIEESNEPSRQNNPSSGNTREEVSPNGYKRVDGAVIRDCDGYYFPKN